MIHKKDQLTGNDLLKLKKGAQNTAEYFQPKALYNETAKALLLEDENHTTPQDSYFSYI
jgi:hypothetical protein